MISAQYTVGFVYRLFLLFLDKPKECWLAQFQRLRDRRSDSPGNSEGLPFRAVPLRGPPEAPPPCTDPHSEGVWNV